jgi:predicted metallo-beta-lactamase superfamily hydrolase
MGKYRDQYQELFEKLKTERDELNVRIHLAKAELRDEWSLAEKQWDKFRGKSEQLTKVADEAGEEIWQAASLLGEEILKGYRKLRDNLR